MSRRRRHVLARWLRRTTKRADHADRLVRRPEVLLCDRITGVREQLLDIAWLLEHCTNPDPRSVDELHKLLRDGCESPLYNPGVHDSELRATLHYIRSALTTSGQSETRRALPLDHQASLEGPR